MFAVVPGCIVVVGIRIRMFVFRLIFMHLLMDMCKCFYVVFVSDFISVVDSMFMFV